MAFVHVPHAHRHKDAVPVTVAAQHDEGTAYARFNKAVALGITSFVGSMNCAYVFAALAVFGLPTAINAGIGGIVQWIAQTFLQLVLLSVILLGQNLQAQAADARAQATFEDAEAILHEALELERHLAEQDKALTQALDQLRHLRPPVPSKRLHH